MRKAGSPPSRFWERLTEALREQGLPTSQIGVGRLVGVTHGTTWLWYHGETLPELDTCRRLALKGRVTVDWLITGREPKYPISSDPVLAKIMEISITLGPSGREAVLKTARREKAQN